MEKQLEGHMEWIHDIKGQEYEQLLTILLAYCDTVQCIAREDVEGYFDEIAPEQLSKKYVTDWPLTKLGHGSVPVLQYTFRFTHKTASFFKWKQSSLFSWQMPNPEDLSFWKNERCIFATCTHEQYVEIDATLQKKIESLFVRQC